MFGYVAPTDQRWFDSLSARGTREEVNFWTPSGRNFAALQIGEPFFFKLKSPENTIGGFGLFLRGQTLPIWLAWESFAESNGVATEQELRVRVRANHAHPESVTELSRLGCRLLADPVFFPRELWVDTPADWQGPIVAGKRYDLSGGEGALLWQACLATSQQLVHAPDWTDAALDAARYGATYLIRPRLGQGSFRLAVYEAYGNACCITGEHSLPVLEAAHIKPYAQGGHHLVVNGLPLRRDLHRLFDLGYVTIKPDLTFTVGQRLRVEYDNGRIYYELHGRKVHVPNSPESRPSRELLEWHNDVVYRA